MNRRHTRGHAMVDALIAFAVLALGLVAILRAQPELRRHTDLTRQQTEAVRLAQQAIEQARQQPLAALVDDDRGIAPDGALGATAAYTVETRVQPVDAAPARGLRITVRWRDAQGQPRAVQLASVIAESDPALAVALAVPR